MSDYEVHRERVVEREVPVTERIVEREVPTTRRTVEHRSTTGGGFGYAGRTGFNPVQGIIVAAVAILLLLLILGAFTR